MDAGYLLAASDAAYLTSLSLNPPEKTTQTALYRHFNSVGRLLYVGISLDAVRRLMQHRQMKAWYTQIAKIELQWFDTRPEALRAERDAIKREHPLFNIAFSQDAELISSLR